MWLTVPARFRRFGFLYIFYLAACRDMAARYGTSLRDFDRAKWQWSKDKTKRKTKKCEVWSLANDGESVLRNASL